MSPAFSTGATPFTFAMNGDELVVFCRGREATLFVARDGRIIGTSGYHAGEELHAVRDESGAVDHFACATFVYTKRPYGH
ncbi:MAG: hypothetical protein U0R78_15415 [Nocardioidaceae bacterium]